MKIVPPIHLRPSVFQPDTRRILERGYASVAHVPVIFDHDEKYLRWPNWYLRDRAEGDWHPSDFASRVPRPQTLRAIAHNLVQWIWWSHSRGIAWSQASYRDILAFQDEQNSGQWSASHRPLATTTSNARADDATHFLQWASDRRLRSSLDVPYGTRRLQIAGRLRTVTVRAGRLRGPGPGSRVDRFVLPRPVQVRDWLQSLKAKRGYAKYLTCRFILEVGPRVGEVEALQVSSWPDAGSIDEAANRQDVSVPMLLIHGTKGGNERTVRIPLDYAKEVRDWIDGPRNKYVYARHKRGDPRTDLVFVSDAAGWAGTPIRRHTISDCFREIAPRPAGWHPHKGRHAFACFFILYALETEALGHGSSVAGMGANWVYNRGSEWITILQRQLGHCDEATTQSYLRWLVTASGLAEAANGWHRLLNSSEQAS